MEDKMLEQAREVLRLENRRAKCCAWKQKLFWNRLNA